MTPGPTKVTPPMVPKSAEETPEDEDKVAPKPGGAKAEAPPKKAPKKEAKKPSRRGAGNPQLQKKLEELIRGLATVVILVNPDDAVIIEEAAPQLAKAYYDLGRENESVRKILERLVETSAWGNAVIVTAMVMLPIAANHGLIPKGFPMPNIGAFSEGDDA